MAATSASARRPIAPPERAAFGSAQPESADEDLYAQILRSASAIVSALG
jgi:hypothetical protein